MDSARKAATYADIEALPEDRVGEIIDGDLIVSPRPAARHALSTTGIISGIAGPAMFGRGGDGGWQILNEPELHLAASILVPDIAGWRRSRMPNVPDVPFFTLAPDWLCEVLSPSTAGIDRLRKLPIYLAQQVGHVWLVDPIEQFIEVFRNEGKNWSMIGTYGDTDTARIAPFEEIELDLKSLWLPKP
jgi:Uma2 family endonuclease